MKITHAKLAQVAQVTTRTIINWEKEKPELIRLLKRGIIADNNAQEFFQLFEPKGFWNMGDFYLDFYFKFLNYYRKNMHTIPVDPTVKEIIIGDEIFPVKQGRGIMGKLSTKIQTDYKDH